MTDEPQNTPNTSEYGADSIKVLKGKPPRFSGGWGSFR